MDIFLQQLVNGLTIGSIYALVALGYTMVYGVLKLINFAHGDLVALSAYIGLVIMMQLAGALSPVLLIITTFIATMIIIATAGVILERTAYRPLRKAPRLSAVVSALGASLVIENGIMLIWGPMPRIFPASAVPNANYNIGNVYISLMQVLVLIISFVLMVALYFFVNRTKLGTAMRACAIDQDAARLMGIDVNRVIVTTFVIGSALGAVGGLFIGMYYRGIHFNMGWIYGLNAFVAAIIGGIGNIPGAMLGGILLGIFNAFISGYLSSSWALALTYVLLIVIMIIRPTGILGERVAEKV
ncbi:branched-chain amino acid ABC transporter permease [Hippea maritima]|uniref:ABC-type transporter, integral membrane subunit n=1 Tax=Hippea maritima (strain ATCC 700847 / DSM 10411 / MH2) TaxID=760142 RepID=F2LWQ3_HIPMA|nr:branched-chain amino acid ABC transporter permease [Hippea maritima]AEA33031.1 ABC-type transporter, integral membrane subunit [Hippea maritima DSM 10411]